MGSLYKKRWKDTNGNVHESKVWWLQYYRDGRKFRESTGTEKETEARRQLKIKEGDIARGIPVTPKMGRLKFRELTDDMMTNFKANRRRTLSDLETRLRLHILPVFGHHRAGNITTADIQKYVTKRQEEGASNGQINRELTHIKRSFNLGIWSGKIITKPHIAMLKEDNVRRGFFEPEEFKVICRYLPEPIRALVTFAYITGWRIRSEVQILQWRQVDFEAGWVRLDPGTTKNNEGRVFPFTEDLRRLLVDQKKKTSKLLKEKGKICPWVFHRNGVPIREFYRSWRTACRKAGLPGRIPHDFRRTAVRNLVRAGIPERVAMQMTGHKTRAVFERYNIVSEGDLLTAARRLDQFMGTNPGTNGQSHQPDLPNRESLSDLKSAN